MVRDLMISDAQQFSWNTIALLALQLLPELPGYASCSQLADVGLAGIGRAGWE